MRFTHHRLLLCGTVCALLSLGQSCGGPSTPPPDPPDNPAPPPVTSCGLIGNNCEVLTGNTPVWVEPADFDGDGDIDLAVANFGTDNVSLLLNEGGGVFTFLGYLPAGDNPYAVLAADLNNDLWPDLAIGSFDAIAGGGVRLYLNTTDSFAPGGHARTATVGNMLAQSDLDGNGTVDLIMPNPFNNNVSILFGAGDGTFSTPATAPVGNEPSSAVAVDLDGDGDPDLAVANELDNSVAVLRNDGFGSFSAPTFAGVGSHPVSIAAADLDGDGDADLITADYGIFEDLDDTLSFLYNNGDGTFAPAQEMFIGSNPNFVIAADLNGDGWPDLAVADGGSDDTDSGVVVTLNLGGAGFSEAFLYYAGDQPAAVAAADLDNDGDVDLVAADQLGNQLWLLGNDGTGSFGE